MRTGFIAYAFNLTLGAWIGAVALRYSLYARLGLGADVTTRIVALSLVIAARRAPGLRWW